MFRPKSFRRNPERPCVVFHRHDHAPSGKDHLRLTYGVCRYGALLRESTHALDSLPPLRTSTHPVFVMIGLYSEPPLLTVVVPYEMYVAMMYSFR